MAKNKKKPDAPGASVVYCGPTIPGVAKQYTIYSNGVAPALAAAADAHPVIRGLIVPLDELPEAMRQLRERSGSIFTLYRSAAQGKY